MSYLPDKDKWKGSSYQDLGSWSFSEQKEKPEYNCGSLIAVKEDPTWTLQTFPGDPITDGHDPCGYWHKDKVDRPDWQDPVELSGIGGDTICWSPNYGNQTNEYGDGLGRFVLANRYPSGQNITMHYSDDGGYNWEECTLPTADLDTLRDGNTVVFNRLYYFNPPDLWLCLVVNVDDGGCILTSSDGITWEVKVTGTPNVPAGVTQLAHRSFYSATYMSEQGKFVVGAYSNSANAAIAVYGSSNGNTWAHAGDEWADYKMDGGSYCWPKGIATMRGMVAVFSSNYKRGWYETYQTIGNSDNIDSETGTNVWGDSLDQNWGEPIWDSGVDDDVYDISPNAGWEACVGYRFDPAGSGEVVGYRIVYGKGYSDDLFQWSENDNGLYFNFYDYSGTNWFLDGLYVWAACKDEEIYRSYDGISWTAFEGNYNFSNPLSDVAVGSDRIIAINEDPGLLIVRAKKKVIDPGG